MTRGLALIVPAAAFVFGACQQHGGGFGWPCTLHLPDGGALVGARLTSGQDALFTGAVECPDQVCVFRADAGPRGPDELVVGYCSGACRTDSDCPASDTEGLRGTCSSFDSQAPLGVPAGATYCAYPIAYPLSTVDAGG